MDREKLFPRHILPRVHEALKDTAVTLIHGPRQCGKSTLTKMIGGGYEYLTFDDINLLRAAQRDPVHFVEQLPGRVILDEIQRAPGLFTTIKHEVDKHRQSGRFILTGSANVLTLPRLSDSLAGRMEIIELQPLAQCEIERMESTFLRRLLAGDFGGLRIGKSGLDLETRVLAGGYPAALRRDAGPRRTQWYRDYVRSIVERDVTDIASITQADALPRLLEMLAVLTAQLVNVSELSRSFQLTRPTVDRYVTVLGTLFLVDFVRPWHGNRNSRLVKTAKTHLADTGLAATILRAASPLRRNDPALFGHLLETFVYTELRKLASWSDHDMQFFHYRDRDNYEVDIVLEFGAKALVGAEVKSASTVHDRDFAGLRRLQRQAGKKMKLGVLLYDGTAVLSFGDGMLAVPFGALWQG